MNICIQLTSAYFLLTGVRSDNSEPSLSESHVGVYMNKIWPVSNPIETYRYYDFPFCRPAEVIPVEMSLAQVIRGDRLTNSLYEIDVGVSKSKVLLCEKVFTASDLTRLSDAVGRKFVFQMFIGGLPVTVPVGTGTSGRFALLCTHLLFQLGYNGDSIVSAEVKCEESSQLTSFPVSFYYSVDWTDGEVPRTELSSFVGFAKVSSLHWMSILNALILAAMASALVLIVLVRTVRADLTTMSDTESGNEDVQGWKLLHGDVFRPPKHRMWLCAAVGAGSQLFLVFFILLVLGLSSSFLQGTLITAGVVLYMLSSALAGFVSAKLYNQLGGIKWRWNIVVTALFFTGPAFVIWSILNTVAIVYNSTAAFPFATIMQLFAMWALVTLPLTVVGAFAGRRVNTHKFPVKTNRIPRQTLPGGGLFWQICISGSIAFCSIYVELKYIFQSAWSEGHAYTLYGVLFVAIWLLLVLATLLTVLFAYLHLNFYQDYKWWWRSFVGGTSVALFVYMYAAVWFYTQSEMDGVMQPVFFFLYSLLAVYAAALVVGTLSFLTTYNFVWYIYSHVKVE